MIVASIMTGTSVDGVDISIVDTDNKKLLNFFEFEFLASEKAYIEKHLWPNDLKLSNFSEFHFKFSDIVAKYFNKISNKILKSINVVVFHGQTVFHDPDMEFTNYPNTLQLGNGAALANKIKKDVLTDIRSSDISVGGQGAPLAGFGDKELFFKESGIAIFNIGGISNVTVITPEGEIKSTDLGVGNSLIDAYTKKYFNIPYDKDGEIASKGRINEELLEELKKDIFLVKEIPKSTGKEVYNIDYLEKIIDKIEINRTDVLATLTSFTAYTLNSIRKFINIDGYETIVAGGGCRNLFLMTCIKNYFSEINTSSIKGINPQARESASFAFFAKYYFENKAIGTKNNKTIFGCLYKHNKRSN